MKYNENPSAGFILENPMNLQPMVFTTRDVHIEKGITKGDVKGDVKGIAKRQRERAL